MIGVDPIKAAMGPKCGGKAPVFDKNAVSVQFKKAVDVGVASKGVVLSTNQLDNAKIKVCFEDRSKSAKSCFYDTALAPVASLAWHNLLAVIAVGKLLLERSRVAIAVNVDKKMRASIIEAPYETP